MQYDPAVVSYEAAKHLAPLCFTGAAPALLAAPQAEAKRERAIPVKHMVSQRGPEGGSRGKPGKPQDTWYAAGSGGCLSQGRGPSSDARCGSKFAFQFSKEGYAGGYASEGGKFLRAAAGSLAS